jgi:hypothetical protein
LPDNFPTVKFEKGSGLVVENASDVDTYINEMMLELS